MIKIVDKTACCGCSACVQRCPKQCINLYEDEEGFLYPKVNEKLCVDCGLCESVCPVFHQSFEQKPLEVFAAKNPDEDIRNESSSGGIFTQLAELTIDAGGVVFGVKWNEHFEAIHAYTETKEGLAAFRGSKYVQSKVGNTFKQAEQFLKQGKKVLYSGTPCQISALKLFLRKEYENLIAVDFICHGTPSPGVFRWYLSEELQQEAIRQNGEIKRLHIFSSIPSVEKVDVCANELGFIIDDIRFRDKRLGWKNFSYVLNLKTVPKEQFSKNSNKICISYTLNKHVFLRGFLCDLYLRPSCHACPAKSGKSKSDITLGDYWGIQSLMPELDDDRGVSAITVNTEKGSQVLHDTTAELYHTSYQDLCMRNPALVYSCKIPKGRKEFYAKNDSTFHERVKTLCRIPLKQRIKLKIRHLLKELI